MNESFNRLFTLSFGNVLKSLNGATCDYVDSILILCHIPCVFSKLALQSGVATFLFIFCLPTEPSV